MDDLLVAADFGSPLAMYMLGEVFFWGNHGLDIDLATAMGWWRKAAEAGLPMAMDQLGSMLARLEGGNDWFTDESLRWWRLAAEKGFPASMCKLGMSYFHGEGQPMDKAMAIDWWQKAASQGSAPAMHQLGLAYADGSGVRRDIGKALGWFRKAARRGYDEAMMSLAAASLNGEGAPKNRSMAIRWWRRAAKLNNPKAWYYLGESYLKGTSVIDPHKAVGCWIKALAEGETKAKDSLRESFLAQFVTKEIEKFRQKAENGDAFAQRAMGTMTLHGIACQPNPSEAVNWWKKAAGNGDVIAMTSLGLAYHKGLSGPKGRNVTKNFKLSAQWLIKANKCGYIPAAIMLSRLNTEIINNEDKN
ncbi:MAG: SEL1-like repeat protein [Deltaproteobacteria bacterium]|nr:SEL1-like repeat protein [Deltaproteobacteria bacterium]